MILVPLNIFCLVVIGQMCPFVVCDSFQHNILPATWKKMFVMLYSILYVYMGHDHNTFRRILMLAAAARGY